MAKEKELLKIIEQVSKEKGIDETVFFRAIEDAVKSAAQNYFKKDEVVLVLFDWNEGEIKIFSKKAVVAKVQDPGKEISWEQARKILPDVKIGEEIDISLPAETLGRISASVAKSIIYDKLNTAEKDRIYKEYFPKTGEIVTGRVRRFLGADVVLALDKAEALLSQKDRLKGDRLERDQDVKSLVKKVFREGKDPQVHVTRTSREFLIKLLMMEIPELQDGTIELNAVVREPGEKAKIAVSTKERNVDPVGACIGMKGNRILAVTRELSGERIDVVIWSEDPEIYIRNAMSPAKVARVKISNPKDKKAIVVVPKDQLAIAIGRQGANVKLASKLTGWHIDLQQEE